MDLAAGGHYLRWRSADSHSCNDLRPLDSAIDAGEKCDEIGMRESRSKGDAAFHGGIRVARSSASSRNKTGNDVWHRVQGGAKNEKHATRIHEACSAWVTTNQIWSRGRRIDNWILVIGRNSEPSLPLSLSPLSIRLCRVYLCACSIRLPLLCWITMIVALECTVLEADNEKYRFEWYTEKW